MATPALQEIFWDEIPKIMSRLAKISVSAAKQGFDVTVRLSTKQAFIIIEIKALDTIWHGAFIHFFDVGWASADLRKAEAMIKRVMKENAQSAKPLRHEALILEKIFWEEMPDIMSRLVKITVSTAKQGFDITVFLFADAQFISIDIETSGVPSQDCFIHFFEAGYANADLEKAETMIKHYMDKNAKSTKALKEDV